MHWGQIKTLLILSFFVLDVYLFMQFMDKKEEADIAILEEQTSSIEEQLKSDDISVENLPDEDDEETYISVKQENFEEDDLKDESLENKQDPKIYKYNLIASKLDKPVKIKEDASTETITDVLEDTVFYPEEYTFWNWNRDANIIIFFQDKKDRPVYYNQNGIVLLYLNDDNEVEYYTQTMLGEEEAVSEEQNLVDPMHAIEELYDDNELSEGDTVSDVKVGYHTRVPFESGVQVFAPIWKINVNDEHDYFINAIEGFTFSSDEEEFLYDVLDSNLDQMKGKRKKDSTTEDIVKDMKKRLETMEKKEVDE
ncbi:MAG TPA: two-component system regulatory protein YycI [Pseudogracilibacillus sp.]|nr:two-component system regulatory protein YycI [Pseudogracilibacillus sp.]